MVVRSVRAEYTAGRTPQVVSAQANTARTVSRALVAETVRAASVPCSPAR